MNRDSASMIYTMYPLLPFLSCPLSPLLPSPSPSPLTFFLLLLPSPSVLPFLLPSPSPSHLQSDGGAQDLRRCPRQWSSLLPVSCRGTPTGIPWWALSISHFSTTITSVSKLSSFYGCDGSKPASSLPKHVRNNLKSIRSHSSCMIWLKNVFIHMCLFLGQCSYSLICVLLVNNELCLFYLSL